MRNARFGHLRGEVFSDSRLRRPGAAAYDDGRGLRADLARGTARRLGTELPLSRTTSQLLQRKFRRGRRRETGGRKGEREVDGKREGTVEASYETARRRSPAC